MIGLLGWRKASWAARDVAPLQRDWQLLPPKMQRAATLVGFKPSAFVPPRALQTSEGQARDGDLPGSETTALLR